MVQSQETKSSYPMMRLEAVDKIVGSFTELANMYNTVITNCNKNAETLNRNIQLTEKRYAAMMKLMQEKKSKTIEQPGSVNRAVTQFCLHYLFTSYSILWE